MRGKRTEMFKKILHSEIRESHRCEREIEIYVLQQSNILFDPLFFSAVL